MMLKASFKVVELVVVLGSLTLPKPQGVGPRTTRFYKFGQTTLKPYEFHIIIYRSTNTLLKYYIEIQSWIYLLIKIDFTSI